MGSFGDKLKRERELRKISLNEIAEATKIGLYSLKALEDEQFNKLPGGIFNKGFVRAYARHLGLDEQQLVAEYLEAVEAQAGAASVEEPKDSRNSYEENKISSRRKLPPGSGLLVVRSIVALILLSAVAVLGWHYWQNWQAHHAASLSTAAQQPQPVSLPAPVATPPTSSLEASNTAVAAVPAETGADAAASGDPVNLTVKAVSRTWIAVTVDGNLQVPSLTLDPADDTLVTRSFHAKNSIRIIMGNPAGIEATFNGKPTGSLGPSGVRRQVIFTPSGRQDVTKPTEAKPAGVKQIAPANE